MPTPSQNRLNFSHFPLQFITNGHDGDECVEQVRRVLDGGCLWVQLRMKEAGEAEVEAVAAKVKALTDGAGATLIIDDHVGVAQRVGASGVHLGKKDMKPQDARQMLGDKFIIGGTCNTFDDILAVKDAVDYIGCGPFRFTTTKKNLAPTLGLDGYQQIVWQCRSEGINIPIVAIGGITTADIPDILNAGPDGIALSGEILRAESIEQKTYEIVNAINNAKAAE
ncbi:MAG: thiamine phosphate synthase [Bacteroidales bacterium]|nr:thiamine phosphate synthase [Bacteroidales bacterium]MDD7724657.1 thiamine phosphate synthase [Bacteroidales bacterium]